MPDDSLRILQEKLEALARNNSAYQEFLNTVKAAEAKITQLHTPDPYGRVPMMTAADRSELMRLHVEIGKAAESVYRENDDSQLDQLVKKITALAAGNHRALLSCDPVRSPTTLPALLSGVRTLTIDTRSPSLMSAVSGQMRKHQPLTFLDDKGREITGVFTPAQRENSWQKTVAGLGEIARGLSEPARSVVANLAQDVDAYARSRRPSLGADKLHTLQAVLAATSDDPAAPEMIDPNKLAALINGASAGRLNGRRADQVLNRATLNQIGGLLWSMRDPVSAHLRAGIPDGSRIDTRSAAMSAVADLLHMPNVIARAKPMALIMPDGSPVQGTFLVQGEGFDVNNLPPEAAEYDSKATVKKNLDQSAPIARACKQIADLQVLDFLCGNIGRNGANMLYQMDPVTRKLCGAQGIDNNGALGALLPGADGDGRNMTALNDLGAVSESTYNLLMALTPEELRFTLRGFDLSEPELKAAENRLTVLQNKLTADKEYYEGMDEAMRSKEILKKDNPYHDCIQHFKLLDKDPQHRPRFQFVPNRVRIIKDTEWIGVSFSQLTRSKPPVDEKGNRIDGAAPAPANSFALASTFANSLKETLEKQTKAYSDLKNDVALGSGNRAAPQGQAKEAGLARRLADLIGSRSTQGGSSPRYDAMQEAAEKYAEYQHNLQLRIAKARQDQKNPDAAYDSIVGSRDLEQMAVLAGNLKEKAQACLDGESGGLHLGYSERQIEAARTALALGTKGAEQTPAEIETAERNGSRAMREAQRRAGSAPEAAGQTGPRRSDFIPGEAAPQKKDAPLQAGLY